MNINETETRQLLRTAVGMHPTRDLSVQELTNVLEGSAEYAPSGLADKREVVMSFIRRHWEALSTTITCAGNCAEPGNICSDAQALACFVSNKDILND